MDKNLFNLKNKDGLSNKVIRQISAVPIKYYEILSLFDLKEQLTPEEVLVGLYRKYKIEANKESIYTTLAHLSKHTKKREPILKGIRAPKKLLSYQKIKQKETNNDDV